MNALKKIATALLLVILSPMASAITDNQVFSFAEANYPSFFAGTATAGQFQQFNYRYYPTSDCYLAVDTAKVIFVLGSCIGDTGGVPVEIGPVAAFADAITTWEAAQTTNPSVIDYSGTWSGSYFGMTFSYVITQTGSNLTLRSAPTFMTAQQTYSGTIIGNTAVISTTDYAVSSATLTGMDQNTVRVMQDSCVASQANAVYCLVPNGTSITFVRQ